MEQRVYFDHDSADSDLVAELRLREIDCLTSQEAGMQRAPDEAQLRFAAEQGRVIVTANQADFARLHGAWMRNHQHHAGIIVVNQSMGVSERMRRIRLLLAETSPPELADRIIYLSSWFGVGGGSHEREGR